MHPRPTTAAIASTENLKKLLLNTPTVAQLIPHQTDAWGRILARIWQYDPPSWFDVGQAQIHQGHAQPYLPTRKPKKKHTPSQPL